MTPPTWVDRSEPVTHGSAVSPLLTQPRGHRLSLHEKIAECCVVPYANGRIFEEIAKLAGPGLVKWLSGSDKAADAAGELGYPVAVKLCGSAIAHKTERGLVHLGLRDSGAVSDAAAAVLALWIQAGSFGELDWSAMWQVAVFAAGFTVLTAIVAKPVGDSNSASVLPPE